MNEELIKERLNIIDKEIEKHEKRITTLERTYSIMEKMDYRVSQIEKTIAEIDKKLDASNEEKGKKWDKLVDYVFYFILSALLTYLCVKTGIK
jgi:ribosome-binding ATPase YchF (GTP1/OBG family)